MEEEHRAPPESLVQQVEALLAQLGVVEGWRSDEVGELRVVVRAVKQDAANNTALGLVDEAIKDARGSVIAKVVDDHPGVAPDAASADRCAPGPQIEMALPPQCVAAINDELHATHQSTRHRIAEEMLRFAGHAAIAGSESKQMLVDLYKRRLIDAMGRYACCMAELRLAWASLPHEIRKTIIGVISGRAVFGLITSKIVAAGRAIVAGVANGGERDRDDPGG